jgi:hypothetical protein
LLLRKGVSVSFVTNSNAIEKMAFAEDHGTRIFDQILASGGLAHIAENIFDHLDVETFANCQLVCKSWRHFIVNITNGQLWKRKYLQKLAKPGTRDLLNQIWIYFNSTKVYILFFTLLHLITQFGTLTWDPTWDPDLGPRLGTLT